MAFGLEIKRLRKEAHISVQKLADLIGVDSERMRKWEAKDMSPRIEDAQKIEEFFSLTIEDIMKLESIKKFLKVPRGQEIDVGQELAEPEEEYNIKEDEKITAKALYNLTESNKALAESNKSLAKSHELLVMKLMQNPTAGAPKGTLVIDTSILPGLLEALAELGSGKRWDSKEEAAGALGRMMSLTTPVVSNPEGIHSDKDK